ncbi:unnamed protein product, partial [marine sediment metagenome]
SSIASQRGWNKMAKELVPVKKALIPEVVDETGKAVTGPEMEAVTGLVTQLAQVAQLARIRKALEREQFKGRVDTPTLSVTSKQSCLNLLDRWHYSALITAYFVNDGPDTAYIAINEPYAWLKIKINETRTVDHTKADKRIERIYHKCDAGETASVRIEGEY